MRLSAPRMAHQQPKDEPSIWRHAIFFLMLACVAAFIVAMVFTNASAATRNTKNGCSSTDAMSGTGGIQQIIIRAGTSTLCSPNNYAGDNVLVIDFPVSSPVQLTCELNTAGTLPPPAPTSVTISGYADNANLGGGGSPLWTQTVAGCAAAPGTALTTECLSSTGACPGTAKAGIVRLFVSTSAAGPTGYNCNSDDAGTQTPPTGGTCNSGGTTGIQGVWRGNPGFTAPNLTSTNAGANHIYVGGDTLRSSLTANASEYTTSTRAKSNVRENSANTFKLMGSAYNIANAAQTEDLRIIGASTTWLPSGDFLLQWTETGNSALTLYSGSLSYWTFTTATVPGDVTVTSKTEIRWDPTDIIDRSLTASAACSVTINGASGVGTVANRVDLVGVSACSPWKDARTTNVPNNQPARGWHQITGTYRDTTDYPSQDGLFGASGSFPTSIQSTTSADTSTGSGYHKMVETFDTTARTDAVLLNWGNSTGVFDVSSTYIATNIPNSKTSGGANASAFTIGTDVENQFLDNAHNRANQGIASLNITCFRTLPDLSTESSVSFGATDINGDTANHVYQVFAPAGTWQTTCSGSMNGNTISYTISYFHTSAFTANIVIEIEWNVTQLANTTLLANLTSCLREYDQTSDALLAVFPDQTPRMTIQAYNSATMRHDNNLLNKELSINEDGPTSTCFFNTLYTSADIAAQGLFAYSIMSFTGSPFVGSEAYFWVNQTGGCTVGCNLQGNFTGNFTGNVTDLSNVPATLSIPLIFYGITFGLVVLAYSTRNLLIALFCFLLEPFMIFLEVANMPASVDANTIRILYAIQGAGTIANLGRFIMLMVQTIKNPSKEHLDEFGADN